MLRKDFFKIKYYILAVLLGMALLGTNIAGWLDPFSILTRSFAVVTPSTDFLLQQFNKSHIDRKTYADNLALPIESGMNRPNGFIRPHIQGILIGSIFLVIIGLNYYGRRFFCNVICPLGALYGLVSRFGLLHFSTTTSCNMCNVCSRNCPYYGNAGKYFLKSECISCFNCVADCPSDSVVVKIGSPVQKKQAQIELGRRKMITALGTGIVLASMSKINPATQKLGRRSFIRPPGALDESKFLSNCSSCGQCTQSCPTGFIQPAFLDAGLEGLWTPIGSAKTGYCKYDCNICTTVCPTDALKKLSVKEKQDFKIGLAVVDKNKCYTYSEGINCTVCYDKCPLTEKAILLKEAEVLNYNGLLVAVKQVYILSDLCIGCGICEFVCPRHDASGVVVVSENESRTLASELF